MFKSLKLSVKLWSFTALLLLAILVVAGTSIWSINRILSKSNQYSNAAAHNLFINEKEVDHLTWMNKVLELFAHNAEALDIELDHTKCGLGKFLFGEEGEALSQIDPEFAALLNEIKEPHQDLHESGQKIKDIWRQRHKGLRNILKDRLDDHRRWAAQVSQIVIEHNSNIEVETDHTLCAFGKFLESEEYASYSHDFPALRNAVEAVKEPHRELHASAGQIKELVKAKNYAKAAEIYKNVTLLNLENVQNHFTKAIAAEAAYENAQTNAYRIFETETSPAVRATQAKITALGEKLNEFENISKADMLFTGALSRKSSSIITLAAFILGGLLSFFIIRSIIRPIHRIIDGLDEGAEQVSAASNQVSSSSQHLAEGSSEQAAALEETSSALEEMSSMTRQNATNATEADALNKKTNQVIGKANESMSDLTTSMKETSKASEEISKIIKTIDEIAFQTNLLALNAAVEAARAGEAGTGFAVVADEVRNLAMRAADAAKNTSSLIEGTVHQIKNGSDLLERTNEAFSEVSKSASKVGELVGEIAAASTEQSDGIEQVNKAVLEMDTVVQRNAANAEENAGASEEMSSMAAQMKSYVSELVRLVDGDSDTSNIDDKKKTVDSSVEKEREVLSQPAKSHIKLQRQIPLKEKNPRNRKIPEQIIPMEDNFEDF